MTKGNVLEQLGRKGADIEAIAEHVIKRPEEIAEIIDALKVEKRAVKFSYEKVLRLVSEKKPELAEGILSESLFS